MEILAIVPAKGNSRRLPNKNIMLFDGMPLFAHSIEQARDSKYISRVVVVTDNSQIASIARQYHAEIIMEPGNFTFMKDVVKWTMTQLEKYEGYKPYYFILLQPTSPLRTVEDIDNAINLMIEKGAESVDSRCGDKQNGAIYICKPHILTIMGKDFIGNNHYVYEMPLERSIDIDEMKDFKEAESTLEIISIKKEKKK
jgi:CMP-N,N'-diacetyllegionaminic acid synthase